MRKLWGRLALAGIAVLASAGSHAFAAGASAQSSAFNPFNPQLKVSSTPAAPVGPFALSVTPVSQLVVAPTITAAPRSGQTPPPGPSVSISDTSVFEPATANGITYLKFSVTTSQPSSQAIKVHYKTRPGTATEPADYTGADAAVLIPAGQRIAFIYITVKRDALNEPAETMFVDLSFGRLGPSFSVANVPISRMTGTGRIYNSP